MKDLFRECGLLLFVLAAVQCALPASLKPAGIAALTAFFCLRTKRSPLVPLILFVLVSVPHYRTDMPAAGKYSVISVRKSYSVLTSGRQNIMCIFKKPYISCNIDYH